MEKTHSLKENIYAFYFSDFFVYFFEGDVGLCVGVHGLRGHGHDGAHVLPLLLYDVPLQEVSSQENPVLP